MRCPLETLRAHELAAGALRAVDGPADSGELLVDRPPPGGVVLRRTAHEESDVPAGDPGVVGGRCCDPLPGLRVARELLRGAGEQGVLASA